MKKSAPELIAYVRNDGTIGLDVGDRGITAEDLPRLVASWDSCRDIPTASLEEGVVDEMKKGIAQALHNIEWGYPWAVFNSKKKPSKREGNEVTADVLRKILVKLGGA